MQAAGVEQVRLGDQERVHALLALEQRREHLQRVAVAVEQVVTTVVMVSSESMNFWNPRS